MIAVPAISAGLVGPLDWPGAGRDGPALSMGPSTTPIGAGEDESPPRARGAREDVHAATDFGSPGVGLSVRVDPLLPRVVAAWAAGVLVLSARLLGGWFLVQRLARRGVVTIGGSRQEAFEALRRRMAVSRPVRLLESTSARVPMVIGWLRPIILMPAAAMMGLSTEQFVAILAHELAHVRRLDYLVNLVQSVAETLLFYHPAVWWLGRRIREEREHCCDDEAVAACGDGLAYARALAAMEELRGQPRRVAPSAAGKPLLARIRRLLGVAPAVDRPAGGLAGLVALASVVALGLTLVGAPWTRSARADVETVPSYAGVVVDAGGSPVAEADLWLAEMVVTDDHSLVVGRARSGQDGRFLVRRQDVKQPGIRTERLALWAHRPGLVPSRVVLRRDSMTPEVTGPVRLTLAPLAEAALRVLDPEGKPVSGAVVGVTYLTDDLIYLPKELTERLGSTTDPAGMATLRGFAPESIEIVSVTSPSLGIQFSQFRGGLKLGTDLRLLPVARVEGRVTAADPASARGLKVFLSTYPVDQSKGIVYGRAQARTDEQGRFSVPALGTGSLDVEVQTPVGSLDRAIRTSRASIEGQQRVELEIPLKRLISVRGTVREKGDGRPVANVSVRFFSRLVGNANGMPEARSDAEGRFVAYAMPGSAAGLFVSPPPCFLRANRTSDVAIGEIDGQTLPPIELERGVSLRGRVVDEAGSPVPGAMVEGKWQQFMGGTSPNGPFMMSNQVAKATSDPRGEFLLEGIYRGAKVSLEAQAGDARTDAPSETQPGAADPVTLRVSRANIVALSGRVVDADGRPVAGARVRFRSRSTGADNLMEPGYLRFEGFEAIKSGPDGTYRTPRQIRRGYAYSAEGDAGGRLTATTPWLRLDPTTDPTLADLSLPALGTVRGRVVDEKGKPVVGVVVRVPGDAPTPIRVVTDGQGQFTLTGLLRGPAFVFVEKPGYRFQWRKIGADESDVSVALVPVGGPPPMPLATLPPALTRADEVALVRRILDPLANKAIEQGGKPTSPRVLTLLARVEPERVLELIGREGFDDRTRDSLRGDLGRQLIRERPEEALALLEAIQNPTSRAYALCDAARGLPVAEGRKLDLLGRAVISARAINDPAWRAIRYAGIGEQYFDLGLIGRATELLREAEAIAKNLPANGSIAARGFVAEELSTVNLPGALALLEGAKEDRDHDLFLGHIAHELAGRDPAEAERVLMMIRDVWPNFRDNYTQRVCHRMAAVDRDRALRLAGSMTNYRHKARAFGAIALTIAPKDRPAAERSLAEAFAILERVVEDGKDQWDGLGTACTAAAGLLPMVEEINPSLLPEYLGRTLALRPPLRGSDTRDGIADLSNAQVAAMVARYDGEAARAVLEGFAGRAIGQLRGMEVRDQSFHAKSVFTAAAVVNPAWAVAQVEGLSGDSDPSSGSSKAAAMLAMAEILSAEGPKRWAAVEWYLLHLWRVDSEDY